MSKIGQYVSNTLTTVTASDLNGLTRLPIASFVYKTALTTVSVPSSVTTIGTSAFEGCTNLSTLSLPDTITEISARAFYNCQNLPIVIPSNVTTIGQYAYYQSCLTIPNYELFIPKKVSSIGNYCFTAISGSSNITSIVFETGSAVKTIPTSCFQYQASATTLTLQSGLTTIGAYSFGNCSQLTSITIPSTVTSIGNAAFQNTNGITEIRFLAPSGATISLPTAGSTYGMFYRKTAKSITVYTDNATIKNYAWSSDNLTCTFKHLDGTDWT